MFLKESNQRKKIVPCLISLIHTYFQFNEPGFNHNKPKKTEHKLEKKSGKIQISKVFLNSFCKLYSNFIRLSRLRNDIINALCLRLFATTVASTLVRSRSHPHPIFVLQFQCFYNSFTVSHICLERDFIFLPHGVPVQRNHRVVHWRLHDILLVSLLFGDILMLSTLDLREKSLVKILSCVLSCSSQGPSI